MDEKRPKAAEVWRERIVAWQSSGRSVRGWCRERGFQEHAFYGWRTKLGLSPAVRKRRRVTQRDCPEAGRGVGFAEVVVEPSLAWVEPIRLRLVGGRELVLPAGMPVTDVAALVHAIEGISTQPGRGAA